MASTTYAPSALYLKQARADLAACDVLLGTNDAAHRCHAVAKSQQAVEKAVKAVGVALIEAGVFGSLRGLLDHKPVRILKLLYQHDPGQGGLLASARASLGELTYDGRVEALCNLAPTTDTTRRNTEYPFQKGACWQTPSDTGAFDATETNVWRELAREAIRRADIVLRDVAMVTPRRP